MKSAEEWNERLIDYTHVSAVDFIKDIQADAFHAGKLEGLAESREIVKRLGEDQLSDMVKSINKK